MPGASLTADDRAFFGLVARAVFANPFSAERDRLDERLAGRSSRGAGDPVLSVALENVRKRVRRLEAKGAADVRAYGDSDDRRTIEAVLLFDVFYQTIVRLDRLIVEQLELGDAPVGVPFARETLA